MDKSREKQTQCNIGLEKAIVKSGTRIDKSLQVDLKVKTLKKSTQTLAVKFAEPRLRTVKCHFVQTDPVSDEFVKERVDATWIPQINANVQTDTFDIFHKQQEREMLESLIKSIRNQEEVFSLLVEKCIALNLDLKFRRNLLGERTVTVTNNSNFGLIKDDVDPVYAIFYENGKVHLHVVFQPLRVFNLAPTNAEWNIHLESVLNILSSKAYVFCPGIKLNQTGSIPDRTTLHSHPFVRLQSDLCPVWYHCENKSTRVLKCVHCDRSRASMAKSIKRKLEETPTRKSKRSRINSKCPISKVTPKTRKLRLKRIASARSMLNHRIKRLESQLAHRTILLGDAQSEEMSAITGIINRDYRDQLDEAIKEAGANSDVLKSVWDKDSTRTNVTSDKAAFFQNQLKSGSSSNTGNRWNAITLRVALAIYHRSPAAYRALKSFNILNLPCTNTLKNRSQHLNNQPGIDQNYLREQEEQYKLFQEKAAKENKPIPKGDGVVIFDEVKVIEKVMWNSNNHMFQGFAMDKGEYPFLSDLLTESITPKPTSYVLQFLWRDLTSGFDLIGPYFTLASSAKQNLLIGCIMETVRVLSAFGFQTSCLVCDGASANLATIKSTMDYKGAFGCGMADSENNFEVKPYFPNPFLKNRNIFWIICPTHQLKSMISALHSSRPNGSKSFKRNGFFFGWEQISELKLRDDDRANEGLLRSVPNMHDSYIIRDQWTRLNVKPSKIMQQEAVLGELYAFGNSKETDLPQRRGGAKECYKYLRACNQIFEMGILSHEKIQTINNKAIESIKKGYAYFVEWLREVKNNDPEINLKDPYQTSFLSWQTWDLLRICIFGFQMFSEDFLSRYPEHFIAPIRINGSAIESLFSQLKYATGSKLSGLNYAPAQKSVHVIQNVVSGNVCNSGYRDEKLCLAQKEI